MLLRNKTRKIKIGNVEIGGDAPVSIQSMTNTDTRDYQKTIKQIKELYSVGCQIIRLAVPDIQAARTFAKIAAKSPIPLIADIHFNHELALYCIKNGANAIRINPGNIKDPDAVAKIANACGEKKIPLRVGVNSGSIPEKFAKEISFKSEEEKILSTANALVKSAIEQCKLLEKYNFHDIKVSLKASDVITTITAYRIFAEKYDYPLHLGITEAGTLKNGIIKSSIGIGTLLLDGIGNTIRVSLTAHPIEEVITGIKILEAVKIRKACPEIISCPTCGRTEINLEELVKKVEEEVENLKKKGKKFKPAKIAVMGCAVNGPGEAKDADIGLSGAKAGKLLIFRRGKIIASSDEKTAFWLFKKILNEIIE